MRQLCDPLSALFQAAAHLLPTVSHVLLYILFTKGTHGEQLIAPYPYFSGGACLLTTIACFVY
jgi:hypothetical protein